MNNASYFLHPRHEWQRRYETLRACFVDRLSDKAIAARFGYKPGYVRLLKHQFRHGKIDFSEPVPEGKKDVAELHKKLEVKSVNGDDKISQLVRSLNCFLKTE